MRTHLLVSFSALLAALPAQLEPSRSPFVPPPATENASVTDLERAATASLPRLAATAAEAVRFDRPREGGPLWALGTSWKASFDQRGLTVIPFFGTNAPRNFPLRLELAQATVGGEPLALAAGEPAVTGTTVRTNRGALTELIDVELDSLEQSFVFDRLPNRGAIAVDVRMAGEYATSSIDGGLRFANEFGHVDYTKAIAVDAAGRRQPLAITWNGASARMEIPAAFVEQAQLPLVLDPILNTWFNLASGQTQLQHDSDVASIQAASLGGRTLLVWQRQWSLTDQDCFGLMFDGTLGLVQTDFTIDFTAEDWLKVAVAGNNYAQNFLVVAESRIGLLWFICGRGISGSAVVGNQFDIERDGVVGLPGNNYHPDVGSDPYFGPGRYCVVFNKRTLGVSDIYMRQVTPTGGLVTTNPVALDTSPNDESRPSISKSCGQSNGPAAQWLVTWQRTYPLAPFDQEVYGRFVTWNGVVPVAAFGLATSASEDTAPSAGSPFDAGGVRHWPVCHEVTGTPGQPRDVVCRVVLTNGQQQASFTVSNNVPGADDRDPEVDSDGTRFVTAFTTGTPGFPQGIEVVTAAYLPATTTFRVEERSGMNTSGANDYGQGNVCADYSGGGTLSPRYFVSFTAQANNTLQLHNFGGYTGGAGNFFTTRPSQCGTLSIAASGSPVIWQTVQFDIGSAPLSGTILGFPGFIPLNALGCNCWQGVDQGLYLGNPLVWTIPNNPQYVGLTLSVQGWTIAGTNCFGFVDLSDTVDFTLR